MAGTNWAFNKYLLGWLSEEEDFKKINMYLSVGKFITIFSIATLQQLIFTELEICEKYPLGVKFFMLSL